MSSINDEILKRTKENRKGNHVADGVQWCPSCGGQYVTMGHKTCRDCDKSLPMSTQEFIALHEKNVRDTAERVAKEEAQIPEVVVLEDDSEEDETNEAEGDEEVKETPEVEEKPKRRRR